MALAEEVFTKTTVCPFCSRAVRYDPEQQSADVAVDFHSRGRDCDKSNYEKVNAKRRCPVPKCKEKLVAVNVFACQGCRTDVCLRHRFPTDHDCALRAAANGISLPQRPPSNGPFHASSTPSAASHVSSLLGRMGLGIGSGASRTGDCTAGTPPRQPLRQEAARSTTGAAPPPASRAAQDSRQQQQAHQAEAGARWQQGSAPANGTARAGGGGGGLLSGVAAALRSLRRAAASSEASPQPQVVQAAPPAAHPPRDPQYIEVCADCGARFDAVGDLIAHYEAVHV